MGHRPAGTSPGAKRARSSLITDDSREASDVVFVTCAKDSAYLPFFHCVFSMVTL